MQRIRRIFPALLAVLAATTLVGFYVMTPGQMMDYGRSLVIGKRSFGSDPARVTTLAGAFIDGMTDAGMAATGKHFPGHGWPVADSHYDIPRDERSLDEIRRVDMQPFAALASRLGGIMPAHVIYSQVDERPAGFSPFWLQQVLRGELGYDGLIFSDDLSMAGAHVAGEVESRVDAALDAGCDMGLVCNNRPDAERAVIHLQNQPRPANPRLAQMRARRWPGADYKASPQWLQARGLLEHLPQARHVAWTTGGLQVPPAQYADFLPTGSASTVALGQGMGFLLMWNGTVWEAIASSGFGPHGSLYTASRIVQTDTTGALATPSALASDQSLSLTNVKSFR